MKNYSNSNLCYLGKVLYTNYINIIEMAQSPRTLSTFYLHFMTNFNLKITYPYTYFLFLLTSLELKCMVC